MKNIYLLFDVPDNQNDKKWLIEGLQQIYPNKVFSVSINKVLSQMIMIQGGIARMKAYWIVIKQCIRTLIRSNKGDIIICWFSTTGKIFNFLSRMFGNKREIISMNWLNPAGKKSGFHYTLAKYAISNPHYTVVVNTKTAPAKWNSYMNINRDDILVIPDVFDDTVSFEETKPFSKVVFSGGYGNRDWGLLMKVASSLPYYKFICVAQKSDFYSKVTNSLPENVELHFNTTEEEYYKLMKSASIMLLPLVGNTISGLVNIIRAAQYGLICCVSKTDSTIQYYSEVNEDLLVESSENDWISIMHKLEMLSESGFLEKCEDFQNHIKTEFSPSNAIKLLSNKLNSY